MSAILGVFPGAGRPVAREVVEAMLARMARRGADRAAIEAMPGATLGVSRGAWELAPSFSGPVLVARDGDVAVAADASLYYVDELRRALADAGQRAGGSPAELILAAYRAWGERCAEHLEGDFAFIVRDGASRRVVCARDESGKRPLYHASPDGGFAAASTVGALLAHPACPGDLDLEAIASAIACLYAETPDTAYRAIRIVPAGTTLVWEPGRPLRAVRHWQVPEVEARDVPPFAEAAEELRRLLECAALERLPADAATVWMSGGWDSSAVFAAARQALAARGDARRVTPVSISYPPGDPGREDELISAIAAHWRTDVRWIDIASIRMFGDASAEAARRDEPIAHMYEHWNRALARGTRASGARVALDGNGGDQFFQVSPAYFADLLVRGRWGELRRDARVRGVRGWRSLAKWAVMPLLPDPALDAIGMLRGGRRPRGAFDRPLPSWFGTPSLPADALLERDRRTRSRPPRGLTCSGRETHFFLSCAAFPRSFAMITELALEEGVELRSPLYDRRVVRFAAARPREERARGGETKRLLRAAMQGLLPAEVLAPRRTRTGMTTGYSDRAVRGEFAPLFTAAFEAPLAAELGIVDGARLRRAWQEHLRTGRGDQRAALFLTLQLELWLRARLRPAAAAPQGAERSSPLAVA